MISYVLKQKSPIKEANNSSKIIYSTHGAGILKAATTTISTGSVLCSKYVFASERIKKFSQSLSKMFGGHCKRSKKSKKLLPISFNFIQLLTR